VTANPDVKVIDRSSDDEFIVDACDGIWDCLSNEEVCDLMREKIKKSSPGPKDYHKPVEEMLDKILAKDTDTGIGTDNMTAILIKIL
jgi:serine/threonine protein phosphatase PrpC